ncbi:hypothetical protein KM427_04850 [Nocardioides sp. LMS-CY]|uniref:hypothetical protein n=1 Tax=Nocardioides sp. (strain LMS-CY) TaxID=2840457 RepID=UPI001C006C8F|nr:hypothetical protein [Nocardioides sp. LMS-CY]QWF23063.1 hypothetical protein KM427_04850 [Nocardioides sp. LMS-CY]
MLDRLLGLASAVSFAAGAAAAPAGPPAQLALTFEDPAIVESSGLVATDDGLFLTTNDSGDGGRVFVVDRSGRTVGTTSWSPDPMDVEALAPAGPGEVWVGDTGDNRRSRESISVLRVPYGHEHRTAEPTAYELVYPDRAHDAETLLAHPRTGQLFVVSKDIFGGTVYAAPKRLSTEHPNRLRAVADGFAFATDGSFFPDGRHYVVRGYGTAAVYTFPGHERVGSFPLPPQQQGEGISVGVDDELYLSTEGQYTDLLRMEVPRQIARAMAPAADVPPQRPVEITEESGTPWAWFLGGGLVAAFVLAGGWLLLRRGQAP